MTGHSGFDAIHDPANQITQIFMYFLKIKDVIAMMTALRHGNHWEYTLWNRNLQLNRASF